MSIRETQKQLQLWYKVNFGGGIVIAPLKVVKIEVSTYLGWSSRKEVSHQ